MFQLSLGYFSFTLTPAPAGQKGPGCFASLRCPGFPTFPGFGTVRRGCGRGKKKIKSKLSSWSQGGKFLNTKNEKGLKKKPLKQSVQTAPSSFRFAARWKGKAKPIF